MSQATLSPSDTIIALSSGQGRAGVAVVRLSGPLARDALQRFVHHVPTPRIAKLVAIQGADGAVLDRALILFFPAPRSFTGEDVVEFHLHGGRAVVQRVLREACAIPGIRASRPGEFTERAFENGKMDLLEVEDLGDLIDSETELQRVLAGGQGRSRFRSHVAQWRRDLLEVSALVEAQIDFSDEDDVPHDLVAELRSRLTEMASSIKAVLSDRLATERVREGFQVVIAGPPNAGKSSLLNLLTGRDVAIVSPIAGTTRDVLEVRLDLDGIPVLLRDVAGLRESSDAIERIGIERAQAAMAEADLVLWLDPADAPGLPPDKPAKAFQRVVSKADLAISAITGGDLAISVNTGHGIAALLEYLRVAAEGAFRFGEGTIMLNLRQESCLVSALGRMESAIARQRDEIEFLSEDLRAAVVDLRALVGEVGVEDVLGQIFSRFCIGK